MSDHIGAKLTYPALPEHATCMLGDMPYELGGALDTLAELDSRVKDMPEYRRLKDLLEYP